MFLFRRPAGNSAVSLRAGVQKKLEQFYGLILPFMLCKSIKHKIEKSMYFSLPKNTSVTYVACNVSKGGHTKLTHVMLHRVAAS